MIVNCAYPQILALITCYILLSPSSAYLQRISNLAIEDGISKPLINNDNGISFRYKINTLGDLGAYLRNDYHTLRLFSNIREFRGYGLVRIRPQKLTKLVNCEKRTDRSYSLIMTHLDFRTKQLSESSIHLDLYVESPYGCRILKLPPRPVLMATNISMRKTRPGAVLGLLAGVAMMVVGIVNEQRYSDNGVALDQEKVDDARGLLVIGLLTSSISANYLYKYESNTFLNEKNRQMNNKNIANWSAEKERIDRKNELIINTYTIQVR